MQSFVLLLPLLLALVQADVRGYNYDSASRFTGLQQNSDIQQIAHMLHPPSPKATVHKQIFTFSPPEPDLSDDEADAGDVEPIFKRRIKIIFIRSPDVTQDVSRAIGKLVNEQATEQKTIIYVLNKQADLSGLANKLEHLKQQNPNKPEVHFVKYRTAAEAGQAMRHIQTQYEALGGSTRVHGAELAPVLKFSSRRTV